MWDVGQAPPPPPPGYGTGPPPPGYGSGPPPPLQLRPGSHTGLSRPPSHQPCVLCLSSLGFLTVLMRCLGLAQDAWPWPAALPAPWHAVRPGAFEPVRRLHYLHRLSPFPFHHCRSSLFAMFCFVSLTLFLPPRLSFGWSSSHSFG